MDIQLRLPDCTLSTEEEALVSAFNQFLEWLPTGDDPDVALRLGAILLEAADVATQAERAQAVGFSQSRSVRVYKQRVQTEGLAGMLKRPIPGRPAISSHAAVEQGVIQVILQAVIEEHALPEDDVLAERVKAELSGTEPELARQVTGSMVKTVRLRWGIHRLPLKRQLEAKRDRQPTVVSEPVSQGQPARNVSSSNPSGSEEEWPVWLLEEIEPKELLPEVEPEVDTEATSGSAEEGLAWLWEGEWPAWLYEAAEEEGLYRPPEAKAMATSTHSLPEAGWSGNELETESLSPMGEGVTMPVIEPLPETTWSTRPLSEAEREELASPPRSTPATASPVSVPFKGRQGQEVVKGIQLGRTQAGGACLLASLLAQMEWLEHTQLLSLDEKYAVTAKQWLLTAIFAVIFGIRRSSHLDDVCDVGFALLTGRARPLSRSTFQYLTRTISATSAKKFYLATAKDNVESLAEGERRLSIDGHNLPRYTHLVQVQKGKIGNTGRICKADELVLAFDLDAKIWLALRTYPGTNHLNRALVEMVKELLNHRPAEAGLLRLFFDKGGYCGLTFRSLKEMERVHFYTPAVRHPSNVKQWQALTAADFDPIPFTYDKHASLPPAERPAYLLADTQMSINVRVNNKVVDTVILRAIVLHDPAGQKPAERWPIVLLTDDFKRAPCGLLNEYGDHWAQEFAHRIGRHDLYLDILPQGYRLKSWRDENGELQREVTPDQTALFLSAWLRCQTYNLMTSFAQALGDVYQRMWAGTLLRLFIRRPATLYLVDKELHVVFDPFPEQQALQPLLDKLNSERITIPWLNHLVFQFSLTPHRPLYPLRAPELRNRLFQRE
jgi:hypothetical protein